MDLVIIPARSGSKGVPGKNIKSLSGKPLIEYTIQAAKDVFETEQIIISTDSQEIIDVVETLDVKVPFVRPKELSGDDCGMSDVVLHTLKYCETNLFIPEKIILLQATSPLRTSKQIKEALAEYNQEIDMVVSVKETTSNPYFVLKEEDENGFLQASKDSNFIKRQDCPKVYELNGAIYVINPDSIKINPMHRLRKVKKYLMDEISSLDIDTEIDWRLAKILLSDTTYS